MNRGYRRRTETDDNFIRKNAATMSIADMARALGREDGQVGRWAKELGVETLSASKPWTRAELKRLWEIRHLGYTVAAKMLRRGARATYDKLRVLRKQHAEKQAPKPPVVVVTPRVPPKPAWFAYDPFGRSEQAGKNVDYMRYLQGE